MHWETKFNIDESIDMAINLFWSKGYKSTSLADLLTVMNINKGSFYNTFGSKKALFTQSLERYKELHPGKIFAEAQTFDNPIESIVYLFDKITEQSINDPDRKGCLIINTAIDLPHHDPDINLTVKKTINDINLFFEHKIKKGVALNLINKDIDVQAVAKSLLSYAVSIRVLSRGVLSENELRQLKSQAMKQISG